MEGVANCDPGDEAENELDLRCQIVVWRCGGPRVSESRRVLDSYFESLTIEYLYRHGHGYR